MQQIQNQEDLASRRYLDTAIARIRGDHSFYATIPTSVYYNNEVKVAKIVSEINFALCKLHEEIARDRDFIDSVLEANGICVCEDCEIGGSTIEQRKLCSKTQKQD